MNRGLSMVLGLGLLAAMGAHGATLSYSGAFSADDETAQVVFNLASASTIQLRSWS